MATWLEGGPTPLGYLLNISNARAPIGNNDHEKALMKSQRYDSMICVNQGVQLVRSEQEASAI
jgi:hypothetical protein